MKEKHGTLDSYSFIVEDLKKSKNAKRLRNLLGVLLSALAIALGLLLRPDELGLSEPLYWAFVVPLVLILLSLPSLLGHDSAGSETRWRLFWGLLGVAIFLSSRPGQFAFEYVYASETEFWKETYNCFLNGIISSVAATGLILLFLKYLPVPSERWIRALSFLPGVVGIVMLNVHCPTGDLRHIGLAHWVPGLGLFLPVYFLVRLLLLRKLSFLSATNLKTESLHKLIR